MNKLLNEFKDNTGKNYVPSDVIEFYKWLEANGYEVTITDNKNTLGESKYGEFLITELDDALNEFGRYTYVDKGAHEVMPIYQYINQLKDKSMGEVAEALSYVLDNHPDGGELVSCIISDMDNREDFDDLFELDDRFEY